jgi:large subunit ribosomal protein L4
MNTEIYSIDGKKKTKSLEIAETVFGITEVNQQLIYDAINCELANKRQGTASTKAKGEVAGTGKKPWRQKGTGRARAGYRRSPVWRGGGIVFGPKPRDYSYSLPKKQKRASLRNILSLKFKQAKVKIVEDFKVDSGKTKDAFKILKVLTEAPRTVLIYNEDDLLFKREFRNIPFVRTISYKRLSAHELFYAKEILILESAAKELENFFNN